LIFIELTVLRFFPTHFNSVLPNGTGFLVKCKEYT